MRSSAVDEDGADASFAGQHLTLLNVPSVDDLSAAIREIWWSANSDSAITYRQRVGLFARPSVGVVVQSLLDPDVAGVMFTQNPINGADERLIEASWGLGEVVVAGRVIPDTFRIDRAGAVLERTPGRQEDRDPRRRPTAAPSRRPSRRSASSSCASTTTSSRSSTRSPARCEEVYGPARDIEWAFADGQLYLLQCRAVTRAGSSPRPTAPRATSGPVEVIERVPLFANMSPRDVEGIAALFKERRFAAGETVTKEGAGGAAFFVIESGEATVSIGGRQRATLDEGRLLRRDRAHRRGRALGDDHRDAATLVCLRAHLLGVPSARAAERDDRLEPAPDAGQAAAHRPRGLKRGGPECRSCRRGRSRSCSQTSRDLASRVTASISALEATRQNARSEHSPNRDR